MWNSALHRLICNLYALRLPRIFCLNYGFKPFPNFISNDKYWIRGDIYASHGYTFITAWMSFPPYENGKKRYYDYNTSSYTMSDSFSSKQWWLLCIGPRKAFQVGTAWKILSRFFHHPRILCSFMPRCHCLGVSNFLRKFITLEITNLRCRDGSCHWASCAFNDFSAF